jgi:hypothetical protein
MQELIFFVINLQLVLYLSLVTTNGLIELSCRVKKLITFEICSKKEALLENQIEMNIPDVSCKDEFKITKKMKFKEEYKNVPSYREIFSWLDAYE